MILCAGLVMWLTTIVPWNEYDNFEDEVFRRVEEELEKLTPRAQDVIRKIYLEGMKYKDVADKLGISVATVNSILVRAIKKTPSTG